MRSYDTFGLTELLARGVASLGKGSQTAKLLVSNSLPRAEEQNVLADKQNFVRPMPHRALRRLH